MRELCSWSSKDTFTHGYGVWMRLVHLWYCEPVFSQSGYPLVVMVEPGQDRDGNYLVSCTGTAIGRGGEFAQPPENAFRAGFLLIRLSREGASCCRSTHLSLFSPFLQPTTALSWASSRSIHAHMVKHGTGGRGEHRTSLAVHRRVVFPAAIAGVR